MDSCTIAEHKLGRVSTFANASFPAASCYSCVFECRSSSFWTGFAHQQVAVCQRYPPLQTDGGKVGLLKLLRQHWTGVCEINVFYQSYVWGWLQWWLLQVLCWHQADHLSQWPGDELCSSWTVQGECSHSSEHTHTHTQCGRSLQCLVFQNYSGELNYLVALHELYKYINKYYDQVCFYSFQPLEVEQYTMMQQCGDCLTMQNTFNTI